MLYGALILLILVPWLVNIKTFEQSFDKHNRYIKTVWGVGYKLVKNLEN